MANPTEPLARYIGSLDDVIAGVERAGLAETTALLKIARLDLVMRAHGISERELERALNTIEQNDDEPTVRRPRVTHRPHLVHSMTGS